MRGHGRRLTLLAALSVALTACAVLPGGSPDGSSDEGARPAPDAGAVDPGAVGSPLPASELEPLVAAQTQRSAAELPPMRLADGLTPPTNRWFSGLVFGDDPQQVFPLPLAVGIDDRSFGFGLPHVVTSADSIVGSHQRDVSVTVEGSRRQLVSAYDDLSVTVRATDADGTALGRTTIAEGSPYVTHVAERAEVLVTSVAFSGEGPVWSAVTPAGEYGVRVTGGTVDGGRIELDSGGSAVFFPVPRGHEVSELGGLASPVTGSTVEGSVEPEHVTTRATYTTAGGGDTAYGVLPHQRASLAGDSTCDLGTLPTVYGDLAMCRGPGPAWTAPREEAAAGLDLSGLSARERREVATQVRRDVAATHDLPADTYFGGKALYRLAQLLDLASRVGADDAAATAGTLLAENLRTWSEPEGCARRSERCFVYDPAWKGVVGQAPAFGSETFNDHHFHYGYFLYAAGVLAAYDPSVVDDLRPVMTLLAADVAGGSDTGMTPRLRVFDAWASHSWASGTSPFADGNNQESTAEAVTAWAGLDLWARAAGDEALARQAVWLMSSEAAAAQAYWLGFDTEGTTYTGFEHGVVGIGWGGKRDHATWFSPSPTAVLGIQLLPMSPSSGYLTADPERIAANVKEATADDGFGGPLGDYVLMYSALGGCDAAATALDAARELPDKDIDDGDSRSYLLAFTLAHQC